MAEGSGSGRLTQEPVKEMGARQSWATDFNILADTATPGFQNVSKSGINHTTHHIIQKLGNIILNECLQCYISWKGMNTTHNLVPWQHLVNTHCNSKNFPQLCTIIELKKLCIEYKLFETLNAQLTAVNASICWPIVNFCLPKIFYHDSTW